MPGKASLPWVTCTSPRRTMRSGLRPSMCDPSNTIDPLQGFSKPEIALSNVDLPVPLPPSSATIWPRPTLRLAPLRICTLPYPPMRSLISSTRLCLVSIHPLLSGSCATKVCPHFFVPHFLSQIGFDHARIIFDPCRRSLGDLFAVLEHAHGLASLHHHLQDMLDDDDGRAEAPLERQYRLEQDIDVYR